MKKVTERKETTKNKQIMKNRTYCLALDAYNPKTGELSGGELDVEYSSIWELFEYLPGCFGTGNNGSYESDLREDGYIPVVSIIARTEEELQTIAYYIAGEDKKYHKKIEKITGQKVYLIN